MLLGGKSATESVSLTPGHTVEAELVVRDPDGGPVSYRWELKHESTATSGGGDYEEPVASLDGYLSDPDAAKTTLTTPAPGRYRLFTYASDEQGRIAHANIPFLVESDRAQFND